MAILQLDITENRPDGQAANERGELTSWQRNWLLSHLNSPPQLRIPFSTENVKIAGVVSPIMMVVSVIMLSGLSGRILTVSSMLSAIVLGAAVFIGIAYRPTFSALWQRYRFYKQAELYLWNAHYRLTHDDYQIESWEGPVRFVIYPPGAYRMFDMESAEDTYAIATPLHIFAVSKTLWEALRPHAENDFTLHYLTEPVPALLSVAQIPLSEPPTDAELASVIGIGDDGELIYEEQNQQARSKA